MKERRQVDGVARSRTGAVGVNGTDGEHERCLGPRRAPATVHAERQMLTMVEPAHRAASPRRGAARNPSPYRAATWMRRTADATPVQQTGAETADARTPERHAHSVGRVGLRRNGCQHWDMEGVGFDGEGLGNTAKQSLRWNGERRGLCGRASRARRQQPQMRQCRWSGCRRSCRAPHRQ